MRVFVCLFAVLCCVRNSYEGALPSFIHPCSASDPKLNECIERIVAAAGPKFAEGIPELGIAPLDPIKLGTINVDNPALNLVFTDTSVSGLKRFKMNSFKMDTKKGKAILDFTANVTLKANYVMDGQILILPIRGNGQAKIKITNLNIIIKYDFETKNGHWVVTSHKDDYKMQKAQFHFTNLFDGNKQLADTTVRFTNENWQLIMQDIAPLTIMDIINTCVEEVKKLFEAIPASELLKE